MVTLARDRAASGKVALPFLVQSGSSERGYSPGANPARSNGKGLIMRQSALLASVASLALVISVAGASVPASAADFLEPAPALAPPTIEPIQDEWIWSVTPRMWYLWENDFFLIPTFQEGSLVGFQESRESVSFPFFGGSLSVTPGLGAPTYSLTVLYGEGSSIVNGVQTFGTFFNSDVNTKRLDIEGIAQIPIATGVSAVLGGRFINFQRDEDAVFRSSFAPELILNTGQFFLEQNFYLGEIGFGVTQPISQSFYAFGNLTGMLGVADVTETSGDFGFAGLPTDDLEGGVFGVDTNAGLGARVTDNIALSARYRLFYLTKPDFDFAGGGQFIHGPEVNLTISF